MSLYNYKNIETRHHNFEYDTENDAFRWHESPSRHDCDMEK